MPPLIQSCKFNHFLRYQIISYRYMDPFSPLHSAQTTPSWQQGEYLSSKRRQHPQLTRPPVFLVIHSPCTMRRMHNRAHSLVSSHPQPLSEGTGRARFEEGTYIMLPKCRAPSFIFPFPPFHPSSTRISPHHRRHRHSRLTLFFKQVSLGFVVINPDRVRKWSSCYGVLQFFSLCGCQQRRISE